MEPQVATTNGTNGVHLARSDKKLESKIEEQLVKGLMGVQSTEEKFNLILKKCVESERINKVNSTNLKQNQKLFENSIREKEVLQKELEKSLLHKSKLESLCRELQKQNKSIKDESFSKIKEEEEKRKETQAKFQKSLNEIQKMMNENADKNTKLKEDNTEMSNKFKFILEQYEIREQQMAKISKQMDLVSELNDAKLAKCKVEAQADKEKFMTEVKILEDTIKILKTQLMESVSGERSLKEQVDLYSSKYGEFQESMKKSHSIFEGYKTDMTKMSKKTFKVEKELQMWKSKYEKSNIALLDLLSEKQVKDEHITKTAKSQFQLQKLCRTLQAERTAYFNALKENNIEIPEVKELPKETIKPAAQIEVLPPNNDKLDLMTKNCDELKKNLAQLQGQLVAIATNEVTAEESEKKETEKADTNAKKNKKNKKKANQDSNTVVTTTDSIQPETADVKSISPVPTANVGRKMSLDEIIADASCTPIVLPTVETTKL